jgi:hypothetical protein
MCCRYITAGSGDYLNNASVFDKAVPPLTSQLQHSISRCAAGARIYVLQHSTHAQGANTHHAAHGTPLRLAYYIAIGTQHTLQLPSFSPVSCPSGLTCWQKSSSSRTATSRCAGWLSSRLYLPAHACTAYHSTHTCQTYSVILQVACIAWQTWLHVLSTHHTSNYKPHLQQRIGPMHPCLRRQR